MTPLNVIRSVGFIAGAVLLSMSSGVHATLLQLAPINSFTTTTYNGFQIQSLDLNDQCSTLLDPRCIPSGPYPVASSPGQIADQAIILAGDDGNQANNMTSPFPTGTAVDNPFLTPAGNQSTSFAMTSINEPANTFTGDQSGSWEVSIASLLSYLDGNKLVFLFDNNQRGTGFDQSLYVWGQVRILDSSGATIECVEFSNGSGCGSTTPDPSAYVPAIGNYCVRNSDGVAYQVGTATSSTCAAGDYFVNDNLGTNRAEYAVFSSFLNDGLLAWANAGYLMSVDVKYSGNNAGNEQLWICSECNYQRVPEPGSLVLLGVALLGLGAVRRKKAQPLEL